MRNKLLALAGFIDQDLKDYLELEDALYID